MTVDTKLVPKRIALPADIQHKIQNINYKTANGPMLYSTMFVYNHNIISIRHGIPWVDVFP